MVPTPLIELPVGPAALTSRVVDTDVLSSVVLRMATLMLGSPSFSTSDLMALGVDLAHVFRLVAMLCERGVLLLRMPRCVKVLMWGNLWRGMLSWSNP